MGMPDSVLHPKRHKKSCVAEAINLFTLTSICPLAAFCEVQWLCLRAFPLSWECAWTCWSRSHVPGCNAPGSDPQTITVGELADKHPRPLHLCWEGSEVPVLRHLPELPNEIKPQLSMRITFSLMHIFLAVFSSLAHFPTVLLRFPGFTSQRNYLPSNSCIKICWWETPN